MEVIGYKCFNKDMTNHYGKKFELNKLYSTDGKVKYGLQGNGYHFCKYLEDTFRYYDAMNNEVIICLVRGSGQIIEHYDDYYGYEVTVAETLEIIHQLSREEIIGQILRYHKIRVKRFLTSFKLKEEEIAFLKEYYKNSGDILATIAYYQENKLDAFKNKGNIR